MTDLPTGHTIGCGIFNGQKMHTTDELRAYADAAVAAERERCTTGWLEAAIAWEVCGSIHSTFAKGKDALFTTRHADFVKHANNARAMARSHGGIDAAMKDKP